MTSAVIATWYFDGEIQIPLLIQLRAPVKSAITEGKEKGTQPAKKATILVSKEICFFQASFPQLPVPKFKKGLGTSVHIVKMTYYQKITQQPEIPLKN